MFKIVMYRGQCFKKSVGIWSIEVRREVSRVVSGVGAEHFYFDFFIFISCMSSQQSVYMHNSNMRIYENTTYRHDATQINNIDNKTSQPDSPVAQACNNSRFISKPLGI